MNKATLDNMTNDELVRYLLTKHLFGVEKLLLDRLEECCNKLTDVDNETLQGS